MKISFSKNHLIFLFLGWWILLVIFSLAKYNPFQFINIFGFIFLSLVPGLLTVLCLRLEKLSAWAGLSLSVALSLLELMLIGLLGNYVLPKFGLTQPLDLNILILEITVLMTVLSTVAWFRLEGYNPKIINKIKKIFPTKLDFVLSIVPLGLVFQSVLGALVLNGGGSGLVATALLGEIALYFLVVYYFEKKLNENTMQFALFFVGLALLLMTSLRGWYITGHDIQSEYKVFEFTKNAGLWNMDFYRDAYNACLSITILPTIFFNFLKVSDPYIFKLYFQFFFALSPVLTYLISRRWISRGHAFLAGIYFVGFPTFFVDMPFLIRQEVAFLFYGLMIYFIFDNSLSIVLRRWLFVIMGVGVILSHYSTNYTTLLIFFLAVASRRIFVWLLRALKNKWNIFSKSALHQTMDAKLKEKNSAAKITMPSILILIVVSFLWTSVVTNSGGQLSKVLTETLQAVGSGFLENNRSTDAVNLLSFRKPSQQQELMTYVEKVIKPAREKGGIGGFYSEEEFNKYEYIALPDELVPLTAIGSYVQKFGYDIVSIVTLFGRALAKFMQVLIPLGLLYILLKKTLVKHVDEEFYLLSFYSLVFIFLIIVIPVLSTEYGIFRAMQQSFYLLAAPMVVGSLWIGSWISGVGRKIKVIVLRLVRRRPVLVKTSEDFSGGFSLMLAVLFFLYSTSFILEIFGGNPALLYLHNTGRYYDNYLIKSSEVLGVEWLNSLTQGKSLEASGVNIHIQTDKYSQRKIASLTTLDATNDIFPGIVRKESYVFVGPATIKKGRATTVYGGDQITYTYPVEFLDENKNLIYDNGSARVYR